MQASFTRARRRAARALAATTLLATCAAHAGTVQPEIGFGWATGSVFEATEETAVLQGGVGYYLDNGVGARLLGIGNLNPFEGWFNTIRTFTNFVGVQAMDQLPLGDHWGATLGAGLGRTRYYLPENSTQSASESEGIVTVGLQWKPARHFSLSLQYSYLTQSAVSSTALMAQFPF